MCVSVCVCVCVLPTCPRPGAVLTYLPTYTRGMPTVACDLVKERPVECRERWEGWERGRQVGGSAGGGGGGGGGGAAERKQVSSGERHRVGVFTLLCSLCCVHFVVFTLLCSFVAFTLLCSLCCVHFVVFNLLCSLCCVHLLCSFGLDCLQSQQRAKCVLVYVLFLEADALAHGQPCDTAEHRGEGRGQVER